MYLPSNSKFLPGLEEMDHQNKDVVREVTSSPIPQIDGTSENVVVTKQLRVVEGQRS